MKYCAKEILYSCECWQDDEFHIGIIEIVSGEEKIDSKGRRHGAFYEVYAKNFSRNGKINFRLRESSIDSEYFRSAVEAVGNGLAHLFNTYRRNAPTRLLESIFGAERKVKVTMEMLPKVIRELQNFQTMFAEAVKLDANEKGGKQDADE